jgi:preprotein translocase subunit SecD
VLLYWFGSNFGASLVMGFAFTLAIGVLVSMFSAIVVTKSLLRTAIGQSWTENPALFGIELHDRPVSQRQSTVPGVAGGRA